MKRGISIFAVVTALLLSFALYEALIVAPTERTMGEVQRIFYYHVPSAWTAFLLFLTNFVASVVYLIRRNGKFPDGNTTKTLSLRTERGYAGLFTHPTRSTEIFADARENFLDLEDFFL